MGMLVHGVWHDVWYDTKEAKGHFKRAAAQFRNWITADGSAGPSGEGGFKAEAGRYHLYVSLACPWAHRTLIFRKLKKLEDLISVSIVDPLMLSKGWEFKNELGGTVDHLFGSEALWQVYVKADPHYSGRVTVPVSGTRQTEQDRLERILGNHPHVQFGLRRADGLEGRFLSRATCEARSTSLNERIYDAVNNGVYKAGFATTQEAYEENVTVLFEVLDELEERLSTRRYLTGSRITEADWRLFTTLVRFDPVYVGHFKCNIRRIADYTNLQGYLQDLYQVPGVAETVDMRHIKEHYYRSHTMINPTGVVPVGPELDLATEHEREKLAA